MTEQTLLEHSERIAKQEERISTHQAKYEIALDGLQADMAERDAQRGTDAPCSPPDAASQTCVGQTSSNGGLVAALPPDQKT